MLLRLLTTPKFGARNLRVRVVASMIKMSLDIVKYATNGLQVSLFLVLTWKRILSERRNEMEVVILVEKRLPKNPIIR